MPLNSLALITVVCFALSLIYIGSTTAYNANHLTHRNWLTRLLCSTDSLHHATEDSRSTCGIWSFQPRQMGCSRQYVRLGVPCIRDHLDAVPDHASCHRIEHELRRSDPACHHPLRNCRLVY